MSALVSRVMAPALPEPELEVEIWELEARVSELLAVAAPALRVMAPALPEEVLEEVILEEPERSKTEASRDMLPASLEPLLEVVISLESERVAWVRAAPAASMEIVPA